MKKSLKVKFAGLMAGLMALSSLGGLTVIPTLAAERVEVNGFTLERESQTDGWTVVDFDGSTVNAVIPDVVSADGQITEDPDTPVVGSVMYIDESVFDDLKDVETLKLPKWLNGTAVGVDFEYYSFTKLENLKAYQSNNTGNGFYVNDDALYLGTTLVNYPQSRTGDFIIKDGTTEIDDLAFKNAKINTLTIPDADIIINEKSQYDDGTDYFRYTLISASVDNFAGDGCVNGALFDGNRLVAYGNNATADLSTITSANPYAFNNVEKLEEISSNISKNVLKSTPFTFYSGEQNGRGFITRYFNVDGKTAYCYEYGVYNPETVSDMSNYNDDITSDPEITRNVKRILFLGYGNDAMNLIAETGISDEAAKNVTGSLVWEYATHVSDNNNFVFDASQIYGDDDISVIQNYYNAIKSNMEKVTDEMMADFELGFYNNGNDQNLIVINKVSRPEIPEEPEKPSITISKQDITTNKELPGAKLTVTMGDKVIDSWTSTDTPHIIENLEDGTYVLTETTAPEGYQIAESIEFTVTDGKVSSDKVVMYDTPDNYIYISKQDATTKKELPGATLQLTKDGKLIDEWISTDTAHVIENPEDGTYTLTEITAPNGYEVAESIIFEVKDGKTTPNPIVMYDEVKVATPSEPDKPNKPIDGGYSGWDGPDEKPETPTEDTGITIIPTQPEETTPAPTPTQPEETAPTPNGERKPIKTGDIISTLQVMFGTMASCGAAGYVIYKKRKK